jgi:hypothetical protein
MPTASQVVERYKEAYKGRFWMPRSSYLPPEVRGTDPYVPKGTDMAVWTYEREGKDGKTKYYAIAFIGKQSKPHFHYTYRDERRREKAIEEAADSRRKTLEAKEERRQERLKFKHGLNVGDILYSSWGYDQTNIDFYEVTKVIGPKFVEIRALAQKTVRSEQTADYVAPIPGRFARNSRPMKKRVKPGDSVKITSYSSAYKWDGKPKYQTSPMYGH